MCGPIWGTPRTRNRKSILVRNLHSVCHIYPTTDFSQHAAAPPDSQPSHRQLCCCSADQNKQCVAQQGLQGPAILNISKAQQARPILRKSSSVHIHLHQCCPSFSDPALRRSAAITGGVCSREWWQPAQSQVPVPVMSEPHPYDSGSSADAHSAAVVMGSKRKRLFVDLSGSAIDANHSSRSGNKASSGSLQQTGSAKRRKLVTSCSSDDSDRTIVIGKRIGGGALQLTPSGMHSSSVADVD